MSEAAMSTNNERGANSGPGSSSTMNMVQAINDALRLEMRRDSRVVVLGRTSARSGASSA